MQFQITTMTCAGGVTKTIYAVKSTAKVEIDVPTQGVTITTKAPH